MAAVGGHWLKSAQGTRFVTAPGPRRGALEGLHRTLLGLAGDDPTPYDEYGHRESREYGAYILADGTTGRIDGEKADSCIVIPDDLINRLAGAHFVHTHPSGGSFSLDDVLLAQRAKVGSLAAVGVDAGGRRWRYTVRPGPGGWKHRDAYISARAEVEKEVYRRGWIRLDLARAAGRADKTFKTALEIWHRDQVMKRLAARTGLEYTRERIR
ncbi:MAG: hypothetical protein GXY76_16380 [Chloroflexi bacterium]|mgnify:CR=1 FL=1|nr:hypothetical protein [Chloroflexota bacterium]